MLEAFASRLNKASGRPFRPCGHHFKMATETFMRNLTVLSLLALTACGVSSNAELSSLDQDQAQSLCEETEERTITCGDDTFSFEITLGGDCDAEYTAPPEGCTATVGDWRDCQDAYAALSDEEICEAEDVPAACDALFDESCISTEQ
jgi:hypothetical protein